MKRFRKAISAVLLLAVLLSFATIGAGAATPSEQIQAANAAIAEINSKKAALEAELERLEGEVDAAQYKANTYAERKNLVEQELELTNTKIDLRQTELAQKQAEIDETQRSYDETYALFKDRLVSMYKNNTASSLSVLLGCDTFSEFLVTADNLASISRHDTGLMTQLTTQKQELEAAKVQVEEELVALEADKAEQEDLYNQLASLYREANNALSEAQALQAATEDDYDELLRQRAEQEAIIDQIMAESSDIEYVGGYYAWPVPGFDWISSPFGWRTLYGKPNNHKGIDIAGSGIYGQNVIASNTGQVDRVVYGSTGYGYYVIVDHGGGYKTLYAHLSAIYVTEGQWVAQGTPIGGVGSTGNSTGPHLHFEVRVNGVQQNPENYVTYGR